MGGGVGKKEDGCEIKSLFILTSPSLVLGRHKYDPWGRHEKRSAALKFKASKMTACSPALKQYRILGRRYVIIV